MTTIAAIPALALLAGAAVGVYVPMPVEASLAGVGLGWGALSVALWRRWSWLALVAAGVGFLGGGAALAADAARRALAPPIVADSDPFRPDVVGAAAAMPMVVSGRVRTDAVATGFGAAFTLDLDGVRIQGRERASAGAVRIAVGGASAASQLVDWRAGRRVRVTATLSAPQPYRNIDTVDQETRLALAGIRLFGSVKSAAHVELLARGRWWEEAAASARATVRHAIAAHVGHAAADDPAGHEPDAGDAARAGGAGRAGDARHVQPRDAQAAAIVTAILIGDRAGLSEEVEERLQRAGTFHVIAISGGNVAILTALIVGVLRLSGLPPRTCASLTLVIVAVYAVIVGAGASVARAALAASVYLFARTIDHRTPTMNVLAVVVAAILVWAPLEIVDPAFWLTCLATFAIVWLTPAIAERLRDALHAVASGGQRARVALAAAVTAPATLSRLHSMACRAGPRVSRLCSTTRRARLTLSHLRPTTLRARLKTLRRGAMARRVRSAVSGVGRRLVDVSVALLAATLAAEAVLLPVTAYAFSQVSIAGLLLNFAAIPLMTIVQIAGLVVVAASVWPTPVADLAGAIVQIAAHLLVETARVVDVAEWSAARVAPPAPWLVLGCHGCLSAVWLARPHTWHRRSAAFAWLGCLALIASAPPLPSFTLQAVGARDCRLPALPLPLSPEVPGERGPGGEGFDQQRGSTQAIAAAAWATGPADLAAGATTRAASPARWLRVTVLDVAQGDATLVRWPDGRTWLIDTGGALGRFDVGTRVVSPALWALAVRRLSILVLTHGDLDHIGGAAAVLRDFRPTETWEGIPIEGHAMMGRIQAAATARGLRWRSVHAMDGLHAAHTAHAGVRIWHPPPPTWTRTRVRNDDSIVLEITVGDVSIVLPGDIEADAERSLARPWSERRASAIRVLKVPHHGSRTSSSARFLDAVAPQIAIVSAGRGNRHGHPAPDVLARYASRGVAVFRTDRDGAVQLDTDGRTLVARSCSGRLLQLGGSVRGSVVLQRDQRIDAARAEGR